MPAPIQSEPFQRLAAELRASGFIGHSDRLQSVLDGVWTTSTELVGELGIVVLAVRKECRPLSPGLKQQTQECLREVRKAWPGFGYFSAFTPSARPTSASESCSYCEQWNQEHPDAPPRDSCGPCVECQAAGHVRAHPRQPTSLCLCRHHWSKLSAPGYHFELYHLIYLVIGGIAAIQVVRALAPFWSG